MSHLCKMFKSRPGDKVHLVATFLCHIRHIVKCSVSLLAETHPRKAGHSVWLNRVPQCGERWSGRFYTLMYCCFIARTPCDSGDVKLHNVALVSRLVLDWSNTRLNQVRQEQSFYMCVCINIYILYILYVFRERCLAADCWDSVTLLLKHKAGPFIYLSRQDVNFILHPHSHMYIQCICIWNMHDTYITRQGLSEDYGFLACLLRETVVFGDNVTWYLP